MRNVLLTLMLALSSVTSYAQNDDRIFQDDLLEHLVGRWNVEATAHGFSSTGTYEASWVLNHQYMSIHFRGNEIVPWIGTPMEFECFIGYKHSEKKYIVQEMTVFGSDEFEGFCYAFRSGNEIKLLRKDDVKSDTTIVQTITWQPSSRSWHIQARPEAFGKAGEVLLDMKLVAVKP